MASMVEYAREATASFAEQPLTQVDALCFCWLAYLRYPDGLGLDGRAGARLYDLVDLGLASTMAAGRRDVARSAELLEAMGRSPRFANVRACLHASEVSEATGMQFSATTFVLPDGAGCFVAFRGTDDSLLGWKENFGLVSSTAIPAQRRAVAYLEEVVAELGGSFSVGGHSKGGALAAYAAGMANDETRAQIARCYSLDGPAVNPRLKASVAWHDDVPVDKVIPRESLVGMLFERSQQGMTVIRSTESSLLQHAPLSWEVRGGAFVREQGMDYDAWRLSQRLNDWLEEMGAERAKGFAEVLSLLVDATAETSFSGLLRRWSMNRNAMRATLDAMPAEDRVSFEEALDDLAATLLLGSRQEIEGAGDGTAATATTAARRLEDASARVNDRLSRIDQYLGR